jgi:hypothetical protein
VGTVYDWQLRSRPERPSGLPEKVGTGSASLSATATILEKKNGVWSYCPVEEELKIDVWLLKHREVVLSDEEVLLWTGMEISLNSTAATRKWMQKDMTVALYPSDHNWWWTSKLKPSRKRSPKKKLDMLAAALKEVRASRRENEPDDRLVRPVRNESALPEALQKLKFDPFETDKDVLIARMPDPLRFHWGDVRALGGDYSIAHNPAHRNAAKTEKPLWAFGICAHPEEAFKALKFAAISDPRFGQTRNPGGRDPLVERFEFEILDAAVYQAMAGRVKAGESPVDRVIDIFRKAAAKRPAGRAPGA